LAAVQGYHDIRYLGWGDDPSPLIIPDGITGPEDITWGGSPPVDLPPKTLFTVSSQYIQPGEYNLLFGMYDKDGVQESTFTFWLNVIRNRAYPSMRGNLLTNVGH
jgi:hypothetical protein